MTVTDGTEAWVWVEFRGGPKDGDVELWGYPVPSRIRFPRPVRAIAVAEVPEEPGLPIANEYAATDDQSFLVTRIDTWASQHARVGREAYIEHACRGKAPMIYCWQGLV